MSWDGLWDNGSVGRSGEWNRLHCAREGAYLRNIGTPEDEFGQQLIDVLELSIEVTVREVVSTISA
jgi:hypothetical protein